MKLRRTLAVGALAASMFLAPAAFADELSASEGVSSWATLTPVSIDGVDSGFFVHDDMKLDDALTAKLEEYEAAGTVSLEDFLAILNYDPKAGRGEYSYDAYQVPADDAWPAGTRTVTILDHTFDVEFSKALDAAKGSDSLALPAEAEDETPEPANPTAKSWTHYGPYVVVEGTNIGFMFHNQLSQAGEVQEAIERFAAGDELSFEDFEAFLNHHTTEMNYMSAAQRAVVVEHDGIDNLVRLVYDENSQTVAAELPEGLQTVSAYGASFKVRFPEAPAPVAPAEQPAVEPGQWEAPAAPAGQPRADSGQEAPAQSASPSVPAPAVPAGADGSGSAQLQSAAPTVRTAATTRAATGSRTVSTAAAPASQAVAAQSAAAPAALAAPKAQAETASASPKAGEAKAEATAKPKPALPVTGLEKAAGASAEEASATGGLATASPDEESSNSAPKAAGAIALLAALGAGAGAFVIRRR